MAGQPKKFKFFLTTKGVTSELLNSPSGWDKTTIEFKRSLQYNGVIRSLSIPFNFVFKGAGIIRNTLYTDFIMSNIKMLIMKLKTSTWEYLPLFSGKIDISTVEDDNRNSVSASVIEDSFSEKVAAFEKVKYEIPLTNNPNVIDVVLTPIPFKEKADFIFVPLSEITVPGFPGLQVISNEVHSTIESVQDVSFQIQETTPDYSSSNKWFYRATTDTNVIFVFTDVFGFTSAFSAGDERFRIVIVDQTGTIKATLLDVTHSSSAQAFSISGTYSINVSSDDKLFMIELAEGDSGVHGFIINQGQMSLSYKTESPESHCNALRASYVFDYLIQKMNGLGQGGAYVRQETQSNLLSTILQPIVITCSNSIRKIVNGQQYDPGDNLLTGAKYLVINGAITYNSVNYDIGQEFIAIESVTTFTTSADGSVILLSYQEVIILSFEDFFQSVKSWMGGNAGCGMDNNLYTMEVFSYYFRNLVTLDLGKEVNGFKPSFALDYLFNTLKIGGQNQQYDTLNGFQETNSTQYYTGDATAIQKELDCVSFIRIDPYGIETLRFTPADTSASRSDNDVWAIWLWKIPFFPGTNIFTPLRGEELISITGVDAGTAYYNWRLTPKQCLLRGAPYLASVFDSQTTLRFTTALKNANLVTVDIDGRRVAERDNVLISDLGPAAFKPMLFKFNCKLKPDAINQLNIMYTATGLTWRGKKYAGFIIEASNDAGANSQRDFTLLSVTDNNFLTLIH